MKKHTIHLNDGDIFYYFEVKNHVVGFIKDGDTPLMIRKYWIKSKKRWGYEVEEVWKVNTAFEYGHYSHKPNR